MADACTKIEIRPGESFECPRNDPGCREKLVEIQEGGLLFRVVKFAIIFLAVLLTISGGVKILWDHRYHPPEPPKPTVNQLLTDVWPWLEPPKQ
jgi:hypothetical protein